jgi:hypothetical protein
MTAATSDRDTPRRESVYFDYPAKGGKLAFAGVLIAVDSATGFAAPCTGAATETVVGRNEKRVDATALADGATTIRVRRGLFRFKCDPANAYTLKDVGTVAHAADDSTLSKAGAAPAGVVRDVEASGDVWIEL